MKAHRGVRYQGFHIFQTVSSQMAVRLSTLCTGQLLLPGRLRVLISVRGWVDRRVIMQLEGLSQLYDKPYFRAVFVTMTISTSTWNCTLNRIYGKIKQRKVKVKKSSDFIRNQARNLLACSLVLQPTTLLWAFFSGCQQSVKCSSGWCIQVVNKSISPIHTPSTVTHNPKNIIITS
jgi:hypothetical protein